MRCPPDRIQAKRSSDHSDIDAHLLHDIITRCVRWSPEWLLKHRDPTIQRPSPGHWDPKIQRPSQSTLGSHGSAPVLVNLGIRRFGARAREPWDSKVRRPSARRSQGLAPEPVNLGIPRFGAREPWDPKVYVLGRRILGS